MGIASFVLGLICLVLSPFLSVFLILPSILALVLGIVDAVIKSKKKESKGLAIAGIVLSTISLAVCILVSIAVFFVFDTVTDTIANSIDTVVQETDITAEVGESATLDDLKVTLVSIDDDFKDYYSYAVIDDDCKILKAEFEFENLDEYNKYVSYSNFECFADKFSCDNFYSVEDSYFYESIEPGKKAKGTVYFEIPKDSKNIEIEFDNSSYVDGKIVFENVLN